MPTGKQNIIDNKNLGDLVWELYDKEGMLSVRIWEKLKESGHDDISHRSVDRYIQNRKRREKKQTVGHDQLPNDLKALEIIEKDSLDNTKIISTAVASKFATQEKFIEHFKKTWALTLSDALSDEKLLRATATNILTQCFAWVSEWVDWLKVHRAEREIALKAIDAKLKYAAALRASRGANINLYRSAPDEKKVPDVKFGGKIVPIRKVQTIPGD